MVTPQQWEHKNNSFCQLSVKQSRWPAIFISLFQSFLGSEFFLPILENSVCGNLIILKKAFYKLKRNPQYSFCPNFFPSPFLVKHYIFTLIISNFPISRISFRFHGGLPSFVKHYIFTLIISNFPISRISFRFHGGSKYQNFTVVPYVPFRGSSLRKNSCKKKKKKKKWGLKRFGKLCTCCD